MNDSHSESPLNQDPASPTGPDVPPAAPDAERVEPLPERRTMSRAAAFTAMGVVALAILLLTMFAPGSGVDPNAPPPGTSPAVAAANDDAGEPPITRDDAAATGKSAPLQFTLKDMNGVDVKLSTFKGKVILVNFWATWCGPCRAEIPALIDLQKQYADDLVVLGVSVDDPIDKLKPYASQFKINYPVLVGDGRTDVQDAFGPLWGIPVSVIIDREGRIAKKHSGIGTREQFEKEVKALL